MLLEDSRQAAWAKFFTLQMKKWGHLSDLSKTASNGWLETEVILEPGSCDSSASSMSLSRLSL